MQLNFYKKRTGRALISIVDVNGNKVRLHENNQIRVKVGRECDNSVVLDLDSQNATANGSYITKQNPVLLYLHQDDAVFPAGVYDMQLSVLDNPEAENITLFAKGRFVLYSSVGGGDLSA
jgi:hypothetical protein